MLLPLNLTYDLIYWIGGCSIERRCDFCFYALLLTSSGCHRSFTVDSEKNTVERVSGNRVMEVLQLPEEKSTHHVMAHLESLSLKDVFYEVRAEPFSSICYCLSKRENHRPSWK